ncbi:MAG TPA: VanZ family protein [Pseudoxanthomonas sp.]
MAAVNARNLLKPFRRPKLWSGIWLLAVFLVIALSLLPAPSLSTLPTGSDKIEHFLAYFLLAAGVVQLFAARSAMLFACTALVVLGVGLEFAQGMLTSTRSQDPFDALANALGVLSGFATTLTSWRDLLLRLEA